MKTAQKSVTRPVAIARGVTSTEDNGTVRITKHAGNMYVHVRGELRRQILAIATAEGVTAAVVLNRILEAASLPQGDGLTITLRLSPAQARAARAAAAVHTSSGKVDDWAMEHIAAGLEADVEELSHKANGLLGSAA